MMTTGDLHRDRDSVIHDYALCNPKGKGMLLHKELSVEKLQPEDQESEGKMMLLNATLSICHIIF